MKKRLALALAAAAALAVFTSAFAQDLSKPLPHSMTKSERDLVKNHFDRYLADRYKQFDTGQKKERKPEGTFWTPGEFERCEGVCFSWAGYSDLLTKLIVDASRQSRVFIGASPSYSSGLKDTLVKAGANGANIDVVPARLDSVWIRDFGPFCIWTAEKKREIIDCVYNRPRPNDDKFPQTIGDFLKIKVHPCKLILPGGNFQTDGHGVAVLTDVVFDPDEGGDPNMTIAQFETYMKEFFGMKKVILLKKMNRDGTGHVDMFSKLLDDRNIIIGEYATPADGAPGNYDILNENAKRMAGETNGLGEKFIVTRIPMPKYDGTSYSHTNSTIVNNLVLVPIYGKPSDQAALDIYKKLMPNHTIKGYDCADIIHANGAIHCITQLVMADPLTIPAASVRADYRGPKSFAVSFRIETKRKMNDDKVYVHVASDRNGPFVRVPASRVYNKYAAEVSGVDTSKTVYYFITAEALDGSRTKSPAGEGEYFTFTTSR